MTTKIISSKIYSQYCIGIITSNYYVYVLFSIKQNN